MQCKNEPTAKSFKASNYQNKYLMLLKRLDEDEGLCDPSIEEKLKLAEDHLKLSCIKFCEATTTLVNGNKTDTRILIEVEKVQELFKPKCFKSSLRPPKSELTTISKQSGEFSSSKFMSAESKGNDKARKELRQAYYLPPSSWFSHEKTGSELSNEDIELLSSCATKAFVKFLEEKKMEIPNIFSRALEKHHKNQHM